MITYHQGDIFKSGAEVLVNPVNCVGVAGAGLAKEFRDRYWDSFLSYHFKCQRGELHLGKPYYYQMFHIEQIPKWIVFFPTKYHWQDGSYIRDIQLGLIELVQWVVKEDIQSIAIPALGCGLGGLPWIKVKNIIVAAFEPFPNVHTMVYEPR